MKIMPVSERLRRVEAVGKLDAGERTALEADLVTNVDRVADDLRVAQAQAELLGYDEMGRRCARAHRALQGKDSESGEHASLDPRGDRGTILKRAMSTLHTLRRSTDGTVQQYVLTALGELEKLE